MLIGTVPNVKLLELTANGEDTLVINPPWPTNASVPLLEGKKTVAEEARPAGAFRLIWFVPFTASSRKERLPPLFIRKLFWLKTILSLSLSPNSNEEALNCPVGVYLYICVPSFSLKTKSLLVWSCFNSKPNADIGLVSNLI